MSRLCRVIKTADSDLCYAATATGAKLESLAASLFFPAIKVTTLNFTRFVVYSTCTLGLATLVEARSPPK